MRPARRTLLLAALAAPALARAEAPDRTVLVVPFPPGGSVDGVARLLAQELTEQGAGTVVVENRPGGAGGAVGAAQVLRAPPDGATLLLNASIHVVVPLINRHVTYDVVEDFSHISLVADGPLLVSSNPAVPATTLGEFFALVRADPGRFSFATTGYGSAGHLCIELLKMRAGVGNEVVAYRGGGPALADLAAGNIHLIADPMLSSLPLVRAGRARALAVTTAARSPLAPDVPTVAESGMEPLEMVSWYALWGPKGMAPELTEALSARVRQAAGSVRLGEKLAALGFTPRAGTPAELRAFVEGEIARYRPIVEAAHIRVE
ncbi:MAG TPA: tripartite tricarboxylate transporter substrate binding protein [Crenalkalicoccus sp.]|nr:tripartite tricarboxylate transporter substrate binding protein [Crenalkalicoccus sp.]